MRLAVAGALAARGPTDDLHDAVCTCVAELKTAGLAPEQVVVAVKRLAADCGVDRMSSLVRKPWMGADSFRDVVVDSLVHWCVEAYFDIPHNGQRRDGRARTAD